MWFQSPEYLRWTRLYHLSPENRDSILALLDIQSGDKVLDVGCGSGEFTRYIALNPDSTFIGINREPQLIEYACNQKNSNTSYILADALHLPFPDNYFDLVVSHTFFTSVSDPAHAMKEMRRVCKDNGRIISITPDSFVHMPYFAAISLNVTRCSRNLSISASRSESTSQAFSIIVRLPLPDKNVLHIDAQLS